MRQSWFDRKAEAAKKNLFEIKRQRVKYLLNNEIESEPVKREDEENKQFLKNMKNNEDSNGIESNVKDEENNQIDKKIKIRRDAKPEEAKATLDLGENLGPWQKTLDLGKSLGPWQKPWTLAKVCQIEEAIQSGDIQPVMI